ncbi:MAG: penicillin acylase family protein [Rhodovibrionaceae bacterium]|nr:penicillin acylase family protein [Rhodovibrionaceae bacterium]
MRPVPRRILIGSGALITFLALVIPAFLLWARTSLPKTEGDATLPGLEAPVEVLRDPDGLVTIRAQSLRDGYRALGFVHAQDRLWQMDLMRRLGAGRISELFGEETFPHDRFMRTLGLERLALEQWQGLSAETRADIEAYTRGVNAFLETRRGALPLEFIVLRYGPEAWQPHHSLLWGKLMALQLSGNFNDEILRARMLQRLPAEKAAFFWPDYEDDAPTIDRARMSALQGLELDGLDDLLPWALQPKSASNAWALSGRRTKTGLPLLANDPHLGLNAPGTWYLARIETPELTIAGATSPGIPYHPIGHNGHAAWGFTTTHSDTQDLFIEKLTGDGEGYETPDGTRPLERRTEAISVRGEDQPRQVEVLATRHGPVITGAHFRADALLEERAQQSEGGKKVLALAWPALRGDDRTPDALRGINRARNWTGFLAALPDFHAPQQNIVFADRAGNIGLAAPARVPIRKDGDGRVPVPGWSGEYDWDGFIAFEDLPVLGNPKNGQIVTANNKLVGESYPYLLTADWPPPDRARRIETLLNESPPPITPETFATMQTDAYSRMAAQTLPVLLASLGDPDGEAEAEALRLLAGWDFVMDRERAAPLIYMAWLRRLHPALFADELAEVFAAYRKADPVAIGRAFESEPSWCDDTGSETTETCEQMATRTFAEALDDLTVAFGESPSEWSWGEAHRAAFPHPLFARVPVLGRFVSYAVATDGGDETINRGGVSWQSPDPFEHRHGPGLRAVFDLANLGDSQFIIATGQSGNPMAATYGNLAKRWSDGVFVKLVGDATEASERLTLNPR